MRDVLHVDDLHRLLKQQLGRLEGMSGRTFNVGGGSTASVSLRELSDICGRLTGKRLEVGAIEETQPADVRFYVSDCRQVVDAADWEPTRTVEAIVEDTLAWMTDNRSLLAPILVPS